MKITEIRNEERQSVEKTGVLEVLELALALSCGRDRASRRDFEGAARLVNPFAWRQLVLLNATLCNRMLIDLMRKLHSR
ncbi:Tetratricopeptide repeat protein 36 [Pteropus alecto]|uniref:Tetratricopeptide repeat protein 36 n=1 Tax=Pteropus alecto TaxID=9402 RepID=L5KM61_PTEAL|nr:Tetratricopeptide repeat protein 36 [Pteropus alecto]